MICMKGKRGEGPAVSRGAVQTGSGNHLADIGGRPLVPGFLLRIAYAWLALNSVRQRGVDISEGVDEALVQRLSDHCSQTQQIQ